MKQVLIAIDQLLNTLLGGWADETLSSRAWRLRNDPVWWWLYEFINVLFFWQHDHCHESYISELLRTQEPPELRP